MILFVLVVGLRQRLSHLPVLELREARLLGVLQGFQAVARGRARN